VGTKVLPSIAHYLMTTRDYHVEQLDDERILENFLTCFRDLDKSNTDQCKYVLRLRSIIAGTARTIVIELDDLRIFSKNEANHPMNYPNILGLLRQSFI
jgi:hypothetical protein